MIGLHNTIITNTVTRVCPRALLTLEQPVIVFRNFIILLQLDFGDVDWKQPTIGGWS